MVRGRPWRLVQRDEDPERGEVFIRLAAAGDGPAARRGGGFSTAMSYQMRGKIRLFKGSEHYKSVTFG